MTKLLKLAVIAEALDVSPREAREICESEPDLRAFKLKSMWRVHPDDLEAFIRGKRGLTPPANVTPIDTARKAKA